MSLPFAVEGLKVVEIEKCKNDLKKLRDEVTSRGGARYNSKKKTLHQQIKNGPIFKYQFQNQMKFKLTFAIISISPPTASEALITWNFLDFA